ncbi:MAG TPA: hypothetical protein VHG88_12460, partial [Burkholderiales bacterium]|nr:hypothetical protein [Burkholderiales bacterium]
LGHEPREYLLVAAMAGHLAVGERAAARKLWEAYGPQLRARGRPVLRLLRCHADPVGCEAAFKAFAAH